MNLNKIIDAALERLYGESQQDDSTQISNIATSTGVTYDSTNSRIIVDKFKKLPYYELHEIGSRHGFDGILITNSEGYEFVKKYGSYSNYLQRVEAAERQTKRISDRSAQGSFWSGIGAMVAIPMSIASFVYTCQKDQKQEQNIQVLSDSLRTTVVRLTEVEKSSPKSQKKSAEMDLSAPGLKK